MPLATRGTLAEDCHAASEVLSAESAIFHPQSEGGIARICTHDGQEHILKQTFGTTQTLDGHAGMLTAKSMPQPVAALTARKILWASVGNIAFFWEEFNFDPRYGLLPYSDVSIPLSFPSCLAPQTKPKVELPPCFSSAINAVFQERSCVWHHACLRIFLMSISDNQLGFIKDCSKTRPAYPSNKLKKIETQPQHHGG